MLLNNDTIAPIVTWNCNFRPSLKYDNHRANQPKKPTDRPTNQSNNQKSDITGHSEFTLPIRGSKLFC